MNIQYLLIANISIIFIYILFGRTSKTKILIDHNVLLFIGIIFYWLMPIYAYENNIFIYHSRDIYESINIENIELFLFFTLLIVITIILSDFISRKLTVVFSVKNFCYSKAILDLFFWFFFTATCSSAYFLRHMFFHDYETVGTWPLQRGWVIAG